MSSCVFCFSNIVHHSSSLPQRIINGQGWPIRFRVGLTLPLSDWHYCPKTLSNLTNALAAELMQISAAKFHNLVENLKTVEAVKAAG